MATEEVDASVPNELHTAIIDAINKGHVHVSDVLDYCGPRGDEQSRGLDAAAYLNEIERLVKAGYVRRQGERFDGQLQLELTETGREGAPQLSETEQTLLEEYGVSLDALAVLGDVIEFESREGDLPSISQLQETDARDAPSCQYTVLFNQLIGAGLATERGLFRFRVKPTQTGRELVAEHEDEL